jgi:hypothetical protein
MFANYTYLFNESLSPWKMNILHELFPQVLCDYASSVSIQSQVRGTFFIPLIRSSLDRTNPPSSLHRTKMWSTTTACGSRRRRCDMPG